MRTSYWFPITAVCALCGTQASAQYVTFQRTILDACYDPNFRVPDRKVELIVPYANETIEKYAALVRNSGSFDSLYYGKSEERRWSLDGQAVDTRIAKDPWIDASTRFEPVAYVRSNAGAGGLITARWKALAADGHLVGTYDAVMVARARHFALKELALHSPAQTASLAPLKTFCLVPGDIEKRQADRARRDAEKATATSK